MSNLENTVLDIMEKVCETDEVREDLDLDLFDAGLLDSLSIISLLLEIEEKLGLRLQPTDIEKEDFTTINNLIIYLKNKGVS